MNASADEKGAMVLLVEEEQDQRAAMSSLLGETGFSVVEAETTDRALQILETSGDRLSALVTDAHVPGAIDGWELAGEARRLLPGLAVVLMSGHSDRTSGPLPEGAEFILKPNVVSDLVPALRRLTT